jgi:trehalose 6-phosphate synthase
MALQSFRLSLRFILPLAVVLGLFAYAILPQVDEITLRWFVRDLEARSQTLVSALQEPMKEYVPQGAERRIAQLLDRTAQQSQLSSLAFCDPSGRLVYHTEGYPDALGCPPTNFPGTLRQSLQDLPGGRVHVTESVVRDGSQYLGKLMLVNDMTYIERRSADARKYVLAVFALIALAVSLITTFVAHLSWRGWVNAMRALLRRDESAREPQDGADAPPEVQPLMSDLRALLHEYNVERRSLETSPQVWNPDKLRALLHDELAGDEVLVVSNREPYIHTRTAHGIEVRRPASGLVTAVEPVMRACSGTWIAHGAGTADRDMVDAHDRVRVPPKNPAYTLRRVWLTEEEEKGYYYGFANEGLWPLCHIAHVRPVFRSSDWDQYVEVNQRFADAVVSEARTEDPVVLVQDYHFALLPRMVRERLPRATIIMFWHIPWPNPESFGICPWREEILEGLLGNTLLGFHTPFHCKNFLETVDRYLETRIEHEASTISYGGDLTQVEPYPISIAWPEGPFPESIEESRAALRAELDLPKSQLMGIGVDRLDYTKGILERLQAVERMLELYPALVGRFTFVQIAAPSRSSLEEYQALENRVRALTQRINLRFGQSGVNPILLKVEHYDSDQVSRYYRAADVCMVTSLHDGMNLVAKEFIASRDDELGVLILSQFTGAARELHEALIINPYHIEQGADALYRALTMPVAEQRERMRSMRSLVRDFNVYRWAGRMLLDAARLRRRERVSAKIRSHSKRSLRRVR